MVCAELLSARCLGCDEEAVGERFQLSQRNNDEGEGSKR
jgi:hypothetical protein